MDKKPLIFLTNDDGVHAKGLRELIATLQPMGRLFIVAPETAQSGMSHAITMTRPLYLQKLEETPERIVYSCNGTPVDCVKIAFDYLMSQSEHPTLAVSGINHGANSAINVLYSGTMGATIETSFYEIPAIGFSLLDHDENADFSTARLYIEQITRKVMAEPIENPLCLNVNIPNLPATEIKGFMPCRQNRGYWREKFERRTNPHGRDYYWLSGYFYNTEPEARDTDEWALNNGYISIVPIQVDLTNYPQLDRIKQWKF